MYTLVWLVWRRRDANVIAIRVHEIKAMKTYGQQQGDDIDLFFVGAAILPSGRRRLWPGNPLACAKLCVCMEGMRAVTVAVGFFRSGALNFVSRTR